MTSTRDRRSHAGSASASRDPHILVYAPFSFNGRGPAETCACILSAFPEQGSRVELFAARVRRDLPAQLRVTQSYRAPRRHLPWRFISQSALRKLDAKFARALRRADPENTLAYFWPDPPVSLVEEAVNRGIPTVREMINTACATSGPILDAAYARQGLPPSHSVTRERIEVETRELRTYDYISAPAPEVEKSLLEIGIEPSRILRTSFGWNPERFGPARLHPARHESLTFLFLGTLNVRKGLPELLQAWTEADVPAELVLAGPSTSEVADLVARASSSARVRVLGYVTDVDQLFRDADVFIFPSHEEGAPQVVYEAAGCGLPIITTPMGEARLVEDETTGLVVEAGSVPQLRDAITRLAQDAELRASLGANARRRATEFDYGKVGVRRYEYFCSIIERRRARE